MFSVVFKDFAENSRFSRIFALIFLVLTCVYIIAVIRGFDGF